MPTDRARKPQKAAAIKRLRPRQDTHAAVAASVLRAEGAVSPRRARSTYDTVAAAVEAAREEASMGLGWRLVRGMRQTMPAAEFTPGVKLGEWMASVKMYRSLYHWFRGLSKGEASNAAPLLRAMIHQLLAGGEELLSAHSGLREVIFVKPNVQYLRDTLILEFPDATEAQSESMLGKIFNLETALKA